MTIRRINLFGGPGTGKSLLALRLAPDLRCRGFKLELSLEYVKSWVFEGHKVEPLDQFYLFAKQLRQESLMLRTPGTIVLTDAPLWQCAAYSYRDGPQEITRSLYEAAYYFDGLYPPLNLLLSRVFEYDARGRWETPYQAELMDGTIFDCLGDSGLPHVKVDPRFPDDVLSLVLDRIQTAVAA